MLCLWPLVVELWLIRTTKEANAGDTIVSKYLFLPLHTTAVCKLKWGEQHFLTSQFWVLLNSGVVWMPGVNVAAVMLFWDEKVVMWMWSKPTEIIYLELTWIMSASGGNLIDQHLCKRRQHLICDAGSCSYTRAETLNQVIINGAALASIQ